MILDKQIEKKMEKGKEHVNEMETGVCSDKQSSG